MKTPEFKFDDSEYLSREGFENLQKELDELKNKRRKEIADRIEYAKSLGDISENAEYQSAKENQWENESRIAELEDKLSRAKIISKEAGAEIQLGSFISIKKDKGEEIENYSLVGSEEADPLAGRISYESPTGAALLGREKGQTVEVLTPNGKIRYTIIDVR